MDRIERKLILALSSNHVRLEERPHTKHSMEIGQKKKNATSIFQFGRLYLLFLVPIDIYIDSDDQ